MPTRYGVSGTRTLEQYSCMKRFEPILDGTNRSPFAIAGPLSQVFSLGVLAQKLNTTLVFDRETKLITNNKLANQLLVGPAPRKGWEKAFKKMHENGDDKLLMADIFEDENLEEWN